MKKKIPPLFKHQKKSKAFLRKEDRVFDMSDPGTGKTRAHAEDIAEKREAGGGAALVLAPKSILQAAWGNDIEQYVPGLKYVVATADNRKGAFDETADVYITNIDAATWLAQQKPSFFKRFNHLVIDECFPAGTLIDTPTGPTPIEVLKRGGLVYTSSGISPITNIMQKESDDLYELELEDGTKIICTGNHPFATEFGWVEARATRNLSVLRTALYKLDQQRTALLQPDLLAQSSMGVQNSPAAGSDRRENRVEVKRSALLEQRSPVPPRNQSQIKRAAQRFWASADTTWREWANRSVRADDARNVAAVLGAPIPDTYWKRAWERLSIRIQAGFRAALEKMGVGSGWQLAHIAQALGCEERFISGKTRVVRVSRIECASKRMVFNLQVDGPHTYSVAGTLVHNCTAFKHHTSQRSKAIGKVAKYFGVRRNLSGSPNPNGMCDLWHQVKLLDDGKRLGPSFFAFRSAICTPVQTGPMPNHVRWEDRDGAEIAVMGLLKDITIRHVLEECLDMPENVMYPMEYRLPSRQLAHYLKMEADAIMQIREHKVAAVNGAVLYGKLQQIASGAVYDENGKHVVVDTGRYELIADLVEQRPHSLVFFQWAHQRDELAAEFEKRGLSFAVVDGESTNRERNEFIEYFQKGFYRVGLLHPKSAGHGLTLTRATTSIWASPTVNAEWWVQANRRAYRAGQTQRTETIVIVAKNTIDEKTFMSCMSKDMKMSNLLRELAA